MPPNDQYKLTGSEQSQQPELASIDSVDKQFNWLGERIDAFQNAFTRRPMLLVLLSMIVGIVLDTWLKSSIRYPLVIAAVFVGAYATIRIRKFHRLGWLVAIVLAASAAMVRSGQERSNLLADQLASVAPQHWKPIVFEGIVDGPVRLRPNVDPFGRRANDPNTNHKQWKSIFPINVTAVRDGSDWQPRSGHILITCTGDKSQLLPGEKIRVFGYWVLITPATNPGQFDFVNHYLRRGYRARARTDNEAQIKLVSTEHFWRVDRYMAWFAFHGNNAIHRYVGHDQSALAAALTLGQREQIEWELHESLLSTGTIHLLAISGLHVEMVALAILIFSLAIQLPRRPTLLLIALSVIGYAVLCGGKPPVIRAMLLVVGVCFARWFYRAIDSFNLLAAVGVIILLFRSGSLFDIGTQLSFVAVFTLMLTGNVMQPVAKERDPIDRLTASKRDTWKTKLWHYFTKSISTIKLSGWVWLITAPMILVNFHVLSPIAILLNVVLWPLLMVSLLSGLGILLLGTWLPPAGFVFGGICTWSLDGMQRVIQFAESIPGSHIWLSSPGLFWQVGFYGLFAVCVVIIGYGPRRSYLIAALLLAWLLTGIIPQLVGPNGKYPLTNPEPTDRLVVTFIDVGHGTSVLIQTPDGQVILYDAGRLGNSQRSYLSIVNTLWYENIGRIDTAIISHADSDHFNGFAGVIKRFPTERLATTDDVLKDESTIVKETLQEFESNGSLINAWTAGHTETIGGLNVLALHPSSLQHATDNANSLCLLLEFADRKIFLPGDLEKSGTKELLGSSPTDVDVLMAPHHGSIAEDPAALLQWCQPEWIAISGSKRTLRSKVTELFEQYGSESISTYEYGAIRFVIESDSTLRAFHWSGDHWRQISERTGTNRS